MLIVTTETLSGFEIVETLGIVQGNVVQAKHLGKDIFASLKTIIGGEIRGYTEMMTESRIKANERMLKEAKQLGAHAVVNVRYATSQIMHASSEILVYGTAVKLKKI